MKNNLKSFIKISFLLFFTSFVNSALCQSKQSVSILEKYVLGYNEIDKAKFINDSILYSQGWNTLPQAIFWKKVMVLPPDSAYVSIPHNRQVVDKIYIKNWNKFSDSQKQTYKDSIRKVFNIPDSVSLLVTVGKKDFYEFKKVIPYISKSIDVFNQNGVDPWYAQAILLIESPGKNKMKSGVGANGPFQLMRSVAIKQGLVVNKYVDERTDIEKAALGASRLLSRICIPYTKAMLDSAHVSYNETDLWFRLLVMHSYHAGAGNVAGVIRKINPSEGGMQLIQQVWQTSYGGFKNASQNYSQLVLAAFSNFDELAMQHSDTIFLIDGDRMYNSYVQCKCSPYDECNYLQNCIYKYEQDLVEGFIPFDYFINKVKIVEKEVSGLTPFSYPYSDNHYNDIGFQLLKSKKTDEAFKVFKQNEKHYPDSWEVYNGLGATCKMMGRKQEAIEYYKKSLRINPDNTQTQKEIALLEGK